MYACTFSCTHAHTYAQTHLHAHDAHAHNWSHQPVHVQGMGLPASGERFHAIRQGQLMMMPHVSVKLQSLIKVSAGTEVSS